ncbi:putative receptor-like protein kinase At3g47110 [Dioscorea cayenensis subsp. rotundata]|uniref:Receptor kinase-like protein Xa21 n=1 Tax=Dioscorea cayennensis subsp. rotundata TaxID=55577 RepID=A0AB40C7P2_DIOCR|nr:putative receptor-like protein kinase At3g47110 [Dioscorea cayenensis subsp. rotundata]
MAHFNYTANMNFPHVHHFATLLLLIASQAKAIQSSSLNIQTDKEALLSLKDGINDPTSSLSSWNETTTVCKWHGVYCNRAQQRVYGLDLQGLGLQGSISPQIGNLSVLTFLNLQDNQLSGNIPSQLGSVSSLNILNISSNLINGLIPQTILNCHELTVLDLSNNLITGSIPQNLELLSKLQIMKLGQNRLNGVIPNSIGNISSLTFLDLGTNTLTGSIPNELGHLHKLQHLQLSINNLTGTVPPSLYNVSSLVFFALASNNLHGEIPADVGFTLPNLILFHFCFNEFTGQIPPSLHNVTKIQSIRMSHNFLDGSVPPGLNMLSKLTMYNIGYNRLVSTDTNGLHLITSLTNCSNLAFLAFDGNFFEGMIPDTVGNLSTNLSKLYMGENQIFGSIPKSIGQLTSLTLLNVSQNLISGAIPEEISKLSELQKLLLSGNQFQGSIPAALGSLTKLINLDLSDNSLAGAIPSTFSNYQSLQSLDLSNNKLNGSIPTEIFSISSLSSSLNLSRNLLSGPLPEEIERLENVVAIDFSDNLLSGDIPESLGKCHSLQVLSMSNNSFTGFIPEQISNLKGLQSLDLSSNQLSGTIPSDLGKLQGLQFLNLSFNDLQGVIPNEGIFKNASRIHLQGNSKLCSSSSPSWCQQSRKHREKISTSRLIWLLVVICVTVFVLVIVAWIVFIRTTRKKSPAKVSANSNSNTNTFKGQRPLISYEELLRSTENFSTSNLIGSGSFGSVFKGVLSDGMMIAIKVLNLATHGAARSFLAECEALKNAKHRNLVKLITSCSSIDFENRDFIALVYDFMSGGSLEDLIHGARELSILDRLNIAMDVASALDYLHNDCQPPVVHCDMKPSNVLLDEDMNIAKVGDFGLAKLMVDQEPSSSTNWIKGSIGYIPPEYGYGGRVSTRGDVYSYGIMLLELLTGKRPTNEVFQQGLSLEKCVRMAFPDRIMEVIDPKLVASHELTTNGGLMISSEKQEGCIISIVRIGLACATDSPEARIGMRDVIQQLKAIKDTLMKPQLDFKVV